jgi:hypothetical protein
MLLMLPLLVLLLQTAAAAAAEHGQLLEEREWLGCSWNCICCLIPPF